MCPAWRPDDALDVIMTLTLGRGPLRWGPTPAACLPQLCLLAI